MIRSNLISVHETINGRVAMILVVGLMIAGCGKAARPAEQEGGVHAEEERAQAVARRVELTPEAVRNARLVVGVAGPATVAVTIEVPGEVRLNAERVLEVRPRYAGVIRDLRKRIGDMVTRGEVVAVVQSNESLTDYEIQSSTAGTVIARSVVTGQSVDHESVLLVIADLSTVWVDFAVYPENVGRIRRGTPVRVTAQNRPDLSTTATVQYVAPVLEQDTRVSSARVVLPNPGGRWQPGLFVSAQATLEQARIAVAVPDDAIVRIATGTAVFRARGNSFELQSVLIGRSDGHRTEIRKGLTAGDSVVVANTFILRSELEKGTVRDED